MFFSDWVGWECFLVNGVGIVLGEGVVLGGGVGRVIG